MGDEEDYDGEEEEEDNRNYKEEIAELQKDLEALKAKNKTLELKKKESDLALNKIKTELNSLRSLDKLWKDAAKAVYLNVQDVKQVYDTQIDQLLDGWKAVVKTSERIQKRSANLKQVQEVIQKLQQKIIAQDETITSLNNRVRVLTTELEDKTKKVERLSHGIEEEVERLCQPMRDKIAESMVLIMKEKAARAQERREIADLWPTDRTMPTILMKYRSLTNEERERRLKLSKDRDASRALTLEIRSNMSEAQSWEIQYDDYGRPFYQHRKTGQVCEEMPEVLSYKPPEGRDEQGNILKTAETDSANWILQTDYKGQVSYRNKITDEVIADPPFLYDELPVGKTREQTVAESATIVLDYIREKISKHIIIKRKRKELLENPLNPEDQKKRDKQLKNRTAEEVEASGDNLTEEGELIELSKYQYDIETVEMLAYELVSSAKIEDDNAEQVRNQRRAFLAENDVRNFKEDLFEGELLMQMDPNELDIPRLRGIVEELAQSEEHLEKKLNRARKNLQDFSFLLQEKIIERDTVKIAELKELRLQQEKDRKLNEKILLVEKKKREAAELEEKERLAELQRQEEEKKLAERKSAKSKKLSSKSKKRKSNKESGGVTSEDESGAESEGRSKKSSKSVSKQKKTLLPVVDDDAEEDDEDGHDEVEDVDGDGNDLKTTEGPEIIGEPEAKEKKKGKSKDQGRKSKDKEKGMDKVPDPALTEILVEEVPPPPLTDDQIEKQVRGDPCKLMFGDLQMSTEEADFAPDLLKLCRDLSNFTMFCGFQNLHTEQYPLQSNANYSLVTDAGLVNEGDDNDDDAENHHVTPTTGRSRSGSLSGRRPSHHESSAVTKRRPSGAQKAVGSNSSATGGDQNSRPGSARRPSGVSGSRSRRNSDVSMNSRRTTTRRDNLKNARVVVEDDDWLTSHFFLTCTQAQLTEHKEALMKCLDAKVGSSGMVSTGPFEPPKMTFESRRSTGEYIVLKRAEDHGYTPISRGVKEEQIIDSQFQFWKAQQLYYDVLRRHLQATAISTVYETRTPTFYDLNQQLPKEVIHRVPYVQLRVANMQYYANEKITSVEDTLLFVQVSLGRWSRASPGINKSPFQMKWIDFEFVGDVDVNQIQLEDLRIELVSEDGSTTNSLPEGKAATATDAMTTSNHNNDLSLSIKSEHTVKRKVVGVGKQVLQSVLGANVQRMMSFAVPLRKDGALPGSSGLTDILIDDDDEDAQTSDEDDVEGSDRNTVEDNNNTNNKGASTETKDEAGGDDSKNDENNEKIDPDAVVMEKNSVGLLKFTVVATVLYKEVPVNPDPQELMMLHRLLPGANPTAPFLQTGAQREVSEEEKEDRRREIEAQQFRLLVAELRGDNWTMARKLDGSMHLKASDRDMSGESKEDMPRRAEDLIDKTLLKKLPRFDRATVFLEKRLDIHNMTIQNLAKAIEERSAHLLDSFKARRDKLAKDLADSRGKLRKFSDQAEDLKKDVVRVTKTVVDLRKVTPEVKAPVFDDLPAVAHVPHLPTTGTIDARGKKKKPVPPNDMKSLLESIEAGGLDGAESWPFADNVFPSQAQQLKLSKASEARNAVLDAQRQQEASNRHRAMEIYNLEVERWEQTEKRRLWDLEKAKKDSRKVNLKYDAAVGKLERYEEESSGLELDIAAIQDLSLLQESSLTRFKQIRLKQYLETQRQQEYIQTLRKRLLRALNARRFALEYPKSAKSPMQYEEFRFQAENALTVLKMEIFECKQLLLQEGIRLRHFLQEESQLLRTELMRINVTLEVLKQRGSFDIVLQKYKFDTFTLLNDLEKLKLREAEKDDEGIETVDDWGERYLPTKTWTNLDIIKCQRMIDLCMAKVRTTEGFSRSAAESQRLLVDCLSSQWGESYFSMRDSWVELSDYDRAQRLVADTTQYILLSRKLLQSERETNFKPFQHFQAEIQLRETQIEQAITVHEQESLALRFSTMSIIDEVRRHLDAHRHRSQEKIDTLESSIVELSRECQNVREELVAQQFSFEEKTKVLWAFIHTLQTSIQQMSAKMEILVEERDKIVIQAKLMADNTRHQLLIERKHSSNLTFIIHSQRGTVRYLQDVIKKITADAQKIQSQQKFEKFQLRRDVWENVFAFTRLCTDVDALFEFFASRLANLAGARFNLNDALARNNAAVVLAALCKNPRPIIRRCAARALGGMGWNGFTEMRVLLWDSMMYWKMFKSKVLTDEQQEFDATLQTFASTGKFDAILHMKSEVEEFVPAGNLSLRSIIKQRRQWALRAARRVEGPNPSNQKLLNIRDQVLTSLLDMCLQDGDVDWEIARNAALAVSIASFEVSNHAEMVTNELCLASILQMCQAHDAEVQTHAAVTIANLTHKDTQAQEIFGARGAIPLLLDMLNNPVADVLEGASAALANLTCYSDRNCVEVLAVNGVQRMVAVMTSAYSENLLDFDQNDEVQANAAEMLANVSRFATQESIKHFDPATIDALVIMCASNNKQLKRNVSLVLGNIAQSEALRHEVGMRGGIEALMLATEDSDAIVQSNALWALTNLMWYPPNQERAGRFTSEIVAFIKSEHDPVKVNACVLLGNLVYYNTTNRVRFLETDGALELIMEIILLRDHVAMVEALLRTLLSLSYLDSIAMWLGVEGGYIPTLIGFLHPPFFSRDSMRYSLEILCNLCLHHANRLLIHQHHGIEAIVPLHADVDAHVRRISIQIVEHLEDITPPEVLARMKQNVGLERMIALATSSDPLVRAVAAESIGEELWQATQGSGAKAAQTRGAHKGISSTNNGNTQGSGLNTSTMSAANKSTVQSTLNNTVTATATTGLQTVQDRAQQLGAVDALLAMLIPEDEDVSVVLPALWSLRNLLHHHLGAQQQFGGYRDGLVLVAQILRRCWLGLYGDQVEKVCEGALAVLINAIQGHERNARRLVMSGLDAILAVAERATTSDKHLQRALESEGVQALAQTLLVTLGPYNYVVCRNCTRRQDLRGTNCLACGHRLLVEIDEGVIASRQQRLEQQQHASKEKAIAAASNTTAANFDNSLHPSTWRHAGRASSPTQLEQLQRSMNREHMMQSAPSITKTASATTSAAETGNNNGVPSAELQEEVRQMATSLALQPPIVHRTLQEQLLLRQQKLNGTATSAIAGGTTHGHNHLANGNGNSTHPTLAMSKTAPALMAQQLQPLQTSPILSTTSAKDRKLPPKKAANATQSQPH